MINRPIFNSPPFLRAAGAVALLNVLFGAPTARAQQSEMTAEQMAQLEQFGTYAVMAQIGITVVFLIISAAILLIARRNMKGWNQPLKWVWFSYSGRLNRKAYWLKGFVLMSIIANVVQLFALLVGMMFDGGSGIGAMVGGIGLLIVTIPMIVFNVWVGTAVAVKRAHDLGHSGWWLLLFIVPFYNIWMAIMMAFFRGTPGPNNFGADPIDPIDDYLDEVFGSADGGGGDGGAGVDDHPHPHPHPPSGPADGDIGGKGFGARTFVKPQAVVPEPEREEPIVVAEMSGGDANLDIIKRRLGNEILRPIQRKGGGGREPEGE
ncbi:DUF805 domain-containing protein [Magnetovibrio blakemorei]|uniref:DUF805 domain-containing protein n=1 Tax=Magnetovibrio blakemorei TaxID=28181 RepID=A0A1E5Q591_9PROT|nr:DUF805 domain-containing protein [Magnetovibrio blakemorei]OEJ65371.1 hypothetical protein BEN30_14740 [Magnetovibrio blakemorei]